MSLGSQRWFRRDDCCVDRWSLVNLPFVGIGFLSDSRTGCLKRVVDVLHLQTHVFGNVLRDEDEESHRALSKVFRVVACCSVRMSVAGETKACWKNNRFLHCRFENFVVVN